MQQSVNRNDLYREITGKIIAELEQGVVPWVRPWRSHGQGPSLSLPKNGLTSRTYTGINILLLWKALDGGGFVSCHWLTFKQALELGGSVRKGEKGTQVFYADRFIPQKERARAETTGDEPEAIPFLKRYTVFNVEQCGGLPEHLFSERPLMPDCQIIPEAQALILATGADFRIGGNVAIYYPGEDYIRVPHQSAFVDQINYYRTAFHELGHWTGHASRLARDHSHGRGSAGYAREELVAEMATAFVCAALGIVPTVRHSDYIGSWLSVLKEDSRAIFKAASQASKAADYLLKYAAPVIEAAA
ncbi:MAG: ArdC family protein [Parvibaculaceae bacterium]